MPVKVPNNLPAIKYLENENIFIMDDNRALEQEIRPLKIAILNLMPNKEATETQLLRLISNTPLQVEVVFLCTASYESKNTAPEHLNTFYKTFEETRQSGQKFDGLIVTGAPVEKMDFTDVAYWGELESIMEWAEHNVYSSMYICWAAQAAAYYHYGIEKRTVEKKVFGIFSHKVFNKTNAIVRGFNDEFDAPVSRHTEVDSDKMFSEPDIDVLASSDESGIYLATNKNLRRVFVFGHGEYDVDSLHNEYIRDFNKGLPIDLPKHYYVGDEVGKLPKLTWRVHESMLIANWLNYCVYQSTPFDILSIK